MTLAPCVCGHLHALHVPPGHRCTGAGCDCRSYLMTAYRSRAETENDIATLLAAQGYPYPGSPADAVRMLLDELAAARVLTDRGPCSYVEAGAVCTGEHQPTHPHVLVDLPPTGGP